MEVMVAFIGDVASDQLRSLRTWLTAEDVLRGQVNLVECPPGPGTLGGGMVEAVSVALGSGGAVTALVAGVVSWVRARADRRHPAVPLSVKLTFADGASVEISTTVAGQWPAEELASQLDHLTAMVATKARLSR